MACGCSRDKRLPKIPAMTGTTREERFRGTRVVFYAMPPKGSEIEPQGFKTVREARDAARRGGGKDWTIEGRREPVTA